MAVLRPLKLVIENYPEGQVEAMEAVNNPEDPAAGTRKVPFSRVLYIEQDDFRDPAPPKYFRLSPGAEVRLRYAYIVKCTGVERDSAGQVTTVQCTYDPTSRGGDARGRRVKGTIHWASVSHSIPAEVRLYDHLFAAPKPDDAEDWHTVLNPSSLEVVRGARLEPALAGSDPGSRYQFERHGLFCADDGHSPSARAGYGVLPRLRRQARDHQRDRRRARDALAGLPGRARGLLQGDRPAAHGRRARARAVRAAGKRGRDRARAGDERHASVAARARALAWTSARGRDAGRSPPSSRGSARRVSRPDRGDDPHRDRRELARLGRDADRHLHGLRRAGAHHRGRRGRYAAT